MARYLQVLAPVVLSLAGWGQTPAPAPTQATAPNQQPATDQQPITTLKVRSRVVELSAVVADRNGAPQTGLTKDDFLLKQDGKDMPIRYFSVGSDLPLTIALMVDTSGSQRTFIGDESLASDVFFETMLGRKEDRALLLKFDSQILQLRPLTNSADQLHLALMSLSSSPATAGATLLNDAVFLVAKDILANETGRKAMVILTDGQDNGSRKSQAEAIEQAQRGNVQIYSILYSAWGRFDSIQGGKGLVGPDPGLEALKHLSEATGGRVFQVSRTQGLREIYKQIGDDLRVQYELGYVPPADTEPNSYHKLALRLKDKRLTVQARHGFFAPPPAP